MLTDSEKKVVTAYLEKLFQLIKQRDAIERSMTDTERGIRSILALHSDEDAMPYVEQLDELTRPEGFTDAIRKVLKASEDALTPSEVKEKLPQVGFDLDGYNNPLASIHTILKRLARTDLVDQTEKDGKTAYKWMKMPRIARPWEVAGASLPLSTLLGDQKPTGQKPLTPGQAKRIMERHRPK
jgi:hypothetical protein